MVHGEVPGRYNIALTPELTKNVAPTTIEALRIRSLRSFSGPSRNFRTVLAPMRCELDVNEASGKNEASHGRLTYSF